MGKKDAKRAAQLQQLADADPEDQFVKAAQKAAVGKQQKEQQRAASQQVQQPTQKIDTSKLSSAGKKRDRVPPSSASKISDKKKTTNAQTTSASDSLLELDNGDQVAVGAGQDETGGAIPPPPDMNAPVEDWGNLDEVDGEDADLQGLLKDAAQGSAGNGPLGVQTFDFSLGEPTEAAFLPVASFLDAALYDNFVEKSTGNHIMVDREDLFAAMLESPFTSVVQVDQNEEEEEPEEDDDEEDEVQPYANPVAEGEEELVTGIDQESDPDFFGILSIIDICRRKSQHISLKQLAALFDRPPVAVIQHGYTAKALFDSVNSESEPQTPSPALLLINDRLLTVPVDVCIQNLQFTLNAAATHMMETMEKVSSTKKKKSGGGGDAKNLILHADPSACALVVMAKILRKGVKEQQDDDAEAPAKKKQRTEAKKKGSSSASSFSLDDFVFVREEDHLLWQVRSEKIAAVVHRFQPTRDQQPEHEIPLCVVFGVMFDEAMEVVGAGLEMEMMSDDEEEEEEEE